MPYKSWASKFWQKVELAVRPAGWLIFFFVLIGGGLAWMISDSGEQSGSSKAPSVDHTAKLIPEGEKICSRGQVHLGARPGAIEFGAVCESDRKEHFRFVLNRYPLTDERARSGARLAQFRVYGRDASGVCEVVRKLVLCTVEVKGAFGIRGTLSVKPTHECARGVTLVVVRLEKCESTLCNASLVREYLAAGRPAGCP